MTILRRIRWGLFPLASLLAGAAVAAPEAVSPGVDAGALIRLIVGLALVLGLIVGLAWLLRRTGGVGQHLGGQLRVLGGLSVGQRERVVLVQVGKTQLLLGVAPGRVQTLHVLDQPLEGLDVPPRGAGQRQDVSFAERLRDLMQQQHQKKR
jgi:flagellar protein FliO/FliZ